MQFLPLTPLPSEESDDAKGYRRVQNEGFVDESVVLSVIAKGPYERVFVKSEDLVLSSSTEDYAGWALPVSSPFRDLLDVKGPEPAAVKRMPAAPTLSREKIDFESGLSAPHTGQHRWWLLGMSGAMTCGILSLTLLSLAQRSSESIASFLPVVHAPNSEMIADEPSAPEPALVNIAPGK